MTLVTLPLRIHVLTMFRHWMLRAVIRAFSRGTGARTGGGLIRAVGTVGTTAGGPGPDLRCTY